MRKKNKLKIFNDPIYGFISVPDPLIFDLIEHPYFQRLRRISQMGLSYLVYPGAHHTRFHHALGCIHLMQKAIHTLRNKAVYISKEEELGLYIAILLHDIGHGPFSHALEESIASKVSHEEISSFFMQEINRQLQGSLSIGIAIFLGTYHRKFLHQLISGQLDIDRLDYLNRDSFYTGVAEGNINSERLISMLTVDNDTLLVEEKGIYSVESFLLARRLMYWQVYLHKTSLVAENILIRILQRARYLLLNSLPLEATETLLFFLKNEIDETCFSKEILDKFSTLDDYDIVMALKTWMQSKDFVLRKLCAMILHRELLKIKIKKKPFSIEKIALHTESVMKHFKISEKEAQYFVFTDTVSNQAYDSDQKNINIIYKSGKIVDIIKATDEFNLKALSKPITKFFICYPKLSD